MTRVTHKKILDVILLLLLLVEASGRLLPRFLHIVLGCIFVAGIVLHCKFNAPFFTNLHKGRWTWRRRGNALVILFFAACLALNAISGAALMLHQSGANWHGIHQWTAYLALFFMVLHLGFHVTRYIHGKKAVLVLLLLLSGAAFAIVGPSYISHWFRPAVIDRKTALPGEQVTLPGKTIAVYFSWRDNAEYPEDVNAVSGASLLKDGNILLGNTQVLAEMVQDATHCDIYSIQVKEPYSANYQKTTQRARQELNEKARPALRTALPDLASYQNIILIYPLWWGTLPMPVETFLEEADLTGKTIIPIVTQGGSSAETSINDLNQLTHAKVIQDPLSLDSSFIPKSRRAITQYLKRCSQ